MATDAHGELEPFTARSSGSEGRARPRWVLPAALAAVLLIAVQVGVHVAPARSTHPLRAPLTPQVLTQVTSAPPPLELPAGTTAVKINLGPSFDPPWVCDPQGTTVCLYFDILNEVVQNLTTRFAGNKNCIVFRLGIANTTGLMRFRRMGLDSMEESSSLSDPTATQNWNSADAGVEYTPVTTMAIILDSIPLNIQVAEILTDVQGYDLMCVKSAGDRIKRTPKLQSEVTVAGGKELYKGTANRLDTDWTPYMKSMGFKVLQCGPKMPWGQQDCVFVKS